MNEPLILWGGTDITAAYYHQKSSIYAELPNNRRDKLEFEKASQAILDKQPIVGICRGAQLLCILNGGSLYQHSETDEQGHNIECSTNDGTGQEKILLIPNVPASHHQIMKPIGNFQLLGWNPNPVRLFDSDTTWHTEKNTPEIIWWPETKCLAIQAHPEWCSPNSGFLLYINKLLELLDINCSFNNIIY